MDADDEMISIAEAGRMLGVSAQTIYVRRKAGRIVGVKAEKQVRFKRSEIMRHAAAPLDRSPLMDAPAEALTQEDASKGVVFYDWRLAQLMAERKVHPRDGERMHALICEVIEESERRATLGIPDDFGRP